LTFKLGWPEVKLIKAETGEQGISVMESKSPHAVILDLSLPDITGFEVLKQIRLFSEVPVLMLTVNGEEPNIVKALSWGANDYLTKPFRQMEFLARVKSMTRDIHITERDMTISSGAWHFGRSLTELYHGQSLFNLTPVEGLIMHTLIKRAEQYVDGDILRLRVWGESRTATADNLRVHIHHLRSKLGDDHGNPGIITSKSGRGYMFKGEKPNKHLTTGIGVADAKSESTMLMTKHFIPKTAKIDKR
jgi:two-component system KDP operon response regulator KdpE/two-component system response regulator VicR